jgi:hypothetical protein
VAQQKDRQLPSSKAQRYLAYVAVIGTLTACFGCGLAYNNQMSASRAFLIVSWLILVPLFIYLLSTYRRTKRVSQKRTAREAEELAALAGISGRLVADEPEEEEDTGQSSSINERPANYRPSSDT